MGLGTWQKFDFPEFKLLSDGAGREGVPGGRALRGPGCSPSRVGATLFRDAGARGASPTRPRRPFWRIFWGGGDETRCTSQMMSPDTCVTVLSRLETPLRRRETLMDDGLRPRQGKAPPSPARAKRQSVVTGNGHETSPRAQLRDETQNPQRGRLRAEEGPRALSPSRSRP